MSPAEKRRTLRVGFLGLVPRTTWRYPEYLAVGIATAFGVIAMLGTWIVGSMLVGAASARNAQLVAQREALSPRVTPLYALQDRLRSQVVTKATLTTQRRSGLIAAERVMTAANALGNDGIAILIDSSGQMGGYAKSFAAISRIWARLGEAHNLTEAKPQGLDISFTFVSSSDVSPLSTETSPTVSPVPAASAAPAGPIRAPSSSATVTTTMAPSMAVTATAMTGGGK